MITVTVDVSQAVAALGSMRGPAMQVKIGAALQEAALLGERTVVGFTPVRTGALRASITASQMGPLAWKIVSPLPYAAIVEDGSRAHTILPHGRLLKFMVGGQTVYARRVNHPGTKPRRMFAQAVPLITAALPQIVARVLAA